MIEHEIDLRTRDGAMNTFVTHPEEGEPFPPVLFYMDAPGKREELHDMARRIATVGYWAALPSLYYRRTREFAMERTECGMRRMLEMMRHLSNTLVVHDTRALLAYADAQEAVEGSRIRFPCTLLEFQTQFPDEASCWTDLRKARWPRGFVCPRCASRGSHWLTARRLEQCRACRYQGSLTAGTVFHGTRVPLRIWFLGIFFLGRHKKGISALQFHLDSGVGSYQTAWALLLRSGLSAQRARRLTGAVEADETYIGGYRPGRDGRGVGKTGVAIAVERREHSAGAVRLAVIPQATSALLTAFVQESIQPQQTAVFTDAWGPTRRCVGSGSITALAKAAVDPSPSTCFRGRTRSSGI